MTESTDLTANSNQ